MHQYLFQDCYEWAGQPRNVWMIKGETTFAGPNDIIPMLEEVNSILRARGGSSQGVKGTMAGTAYSPRTRR